MKSVYPTALVAFQKNVAAQTMYCKQIGQKHVFHQGSNTEKSQAKSGNHLLPPIHNKCTFWHVQSIFVQSTQKLAHSLFIIN